MIGRDENLPASISDKSTISRRHAELERRQIVSRAAFSQIRDFLADALRRIAVHQIGVAFLGDQLFGRRRFAARVKRGPRLGNRFGLKNVVFHPVVLPRI